jgi:Tol biopolymer transport system component
MKPTVPLLRALLALALLASPALAQKVVRVSVGAFGEGHGHSYSPALSTNGRYVAFSSYSYNLVPLDLNGFEDVFVRDRRLQTTYLVSRSSNGLQGDADSGYPTLSASGRFVCFLSRASNLVPGDTNGLIDVFVRDLLLGTTQCVSVGPAGVTGNAESYAGRIAAGGRYVVFESYATDLVPGDTNGVSDVFVRDLVAGSTVRVNVASGGAQANRASHDSDISGDGRRVVFTSTATNLSPDDTDPKMDTFVHDLATGTTTLVSVSSEGVQANTGAGNYPRISANGRFVTFSTWADNLVPDDTNETSDVFVRDLVAGTTTRVGVSSSGDEANAQTWRGVLSGDGRLVAFRSLASNLSPGDDNGLPDVFLHDRGTGNTWRVSEAPGHASGNDYSSQAEISLNGRTVGFYSNASNHVPGDTNDLWDVFVRDLGKAREHEGL